MTTLDRATATSDLLATLVDGPWSAGCRLAELAAAAPDDLAARLGIPQEAARRVFAAFELARRRDLEARPARPIFDTPARVFEWVHSATRDEDVETFRTLVLDARNRFLAEVVVSRGILTASLVHPREVFKPALVRAGAAVVVVHNHPSGDPTPSRDDDAITDRLARAGDLLGVPLLDHVVIGDRSFWSYREHGALGAETLGRRATTPIDCRGQKPLSNGGG